MAKLPNKRPQTGSCIFYVICTVFLAGLGLVNVHLVMQTTRLSQELGNLRDRLGDNKDTLSILKRGRRSNREVEAHGIHLEAYISADTPEDIGHNTSTGFVPNGLVYRMWSPRKWTGNRKYFRYHQSTGKVKVNKRGIYLVYVQVIFHDPAARRDIGLYINEEADPRILCLKYDVMKGSSREVSSVDDGSRYSVYSHCSVVGQVFLNKNDQVFIKTTSANRTIIARPHITFWGLSKL